MGGRFDVRKKGRADLVTQADVASQEAIRRKVLEAFPSHGFLGEESKAADIASRHRVPMDRRSAGWHHELCPRGAAYCISLPWSKMARYFAGGLQSVRNECFLASKGKGATLNGQPLHERRVGRFRGIGGLQLPYEVKPNSPDLLLFLEMLYCCQSIRRTGSAHLNLCYLLPAASMRFGRVRPTFGTLRRAS